MPKKNEGLNVDEWLARCAWCLRALSENEERITLGVKLRPGADRLLPPGTMQAFPLVKAAKTVPIIIAALGSPARHAGQDASFQVCSDACGIALQTALQEEGILLGPSTSA